MMLQYRRYRNDAARNACRTAFAPRFTNIITGTYIFSLGKFKILMKRLISED
jgi:hypothetical protein